MLVLYTDGVTEARRNDAYFGEQRLHRIVLDATGSAQQAADDVLERSLEFQRNSPRDDIAVVVVVVP
jgi:serine phosphatase RsbU (regulator of sigma subunit)